MSNRRDSIISNLEKVLVELKAGEKYAEESFYPVDMAKTIIKELGCLLDGSTHYRLCFPRCFMIALYVNGGVLMAFSRSRLKSKPLDREVLRLNLKTNSSR